MVKDVGIRRKRVLCRGIIENHVVSSSHHVANDGLRQHCGVGGGISLVHRDGIAARGRLRLNQELIALWADEKTAFSAGVLDRRAHETVDERFQHHLARDRLGDFHHRGEIQEFGSAPGLRSSARRAIPS